MTSTRWVPRFLTLAILSIGLGLFPNNAGALTKVGVLAPFSGPAASLGTDVQRAVSAAVADGGRRQLEVVFMDTAARPEIAVQRARQLLHEHRVHVLLGPILASEARAVVSITDLQVPIFVPVSVSVDRDRLHWVFPTEPSFEVLHGTALAKWSTASTSSRPRNVAVIFDKSDERVYRPRFRGHRVDGNPHAARRSVDRARTAAGV
jgi:ABC-type branched-subunit amino acid transport system substrate-binding protein